MFRGSASPERKENNILNIHTLAKYLMLTVLYKNIHGIGPSVLKFERLGNARATRATGQYVLKVRRHRSCYCGRAFGARAVAEWNKLPDDLRVTTSYQIFKMNLKSYLMRQQGNTT